MEHQAIKIHAGKYEYRGHTITSFIWFGKTMWEIETPNLYTNPSRFDGQEFTSLLTQHTIADAKNQIDKFLYNKQNQKEEN